MSASQRNPGPTISVDPSLVGILRLQTLLVLEANHQLFEDVRCLPAAELLALATIWRDAFTVLDAIGWLPAPSTGAAPVAITTGHLAQLRRRRDEETAAILDTLDARDRATASDDRTQLDCEIRGRHRAVGGLERLLRQVDDGRRR